MANRTKKTKRAKAPRKVRAPKTPRNGAKKTSRPAPGPKRARAKAADGTTPAVRAWLAAHGLEGRKVGKAVVTKKPKGRSGVARGFGPSLEALDRLVDPATARLITVPVRSKVGPDRFYVMPDLPGFLLFEVEKDRRVAEADRELPWDDGKLVVLGPKKAAFVNGHDPVYVVQNDEGSFAVQAIERESAPSAQEIVEAIVNTFGAPQWLSQEARLLADVPGPLAPASAVGMAARLWSRPAGVEGKKAEAALLAGKAPKGMARAWWKSLSDRARREVEASALDWTGGLAEELEEIAEDAVANPEGAAVAASLWIDGRDDLESVAYVMGEKDGRLLRESLVALDKRAVANLAMLSDLHLRPSERRAATSWMEPNAWWGRLG